MKNIEDDFEVGQSIHVGDHIVTIIEIDGDDVFFQIEENNEAIDIKDNNPDKKKGFSSSPPRPR